MNTKMLKRAVLSVAVMVGVSGTAAAGFVDESSRNPFAQTSQMKIIGTDHFEMIYGYARGVPLNEAIGQIVPKNYVVRAHGMEHIARTNVTWSGGKAWTESLREAVAHIPGVMVEVDTHTKVVMFSYRPGAGLAQPSGAQGPHNTHNPYALPGAAGGGGVWDLRSDDGTVRTAFQRWATAAGWQLVWDLDVDYPVEAEAALNLSFEEAVEAVTKSMQASTVPPKAIFYRGNRVLRIVGRGDE
jgi:hypothetical protein